MSEKIIGPFTGEYEYLSNFFPISVVLQGKVYPSVEHAYVAAKTFDLDEREKIKNMPAKTAGYVKRMGRTLKLRKDWEQVKEEIMRDLVYQKFKNKHLQQFLLETGELKIVEINYWHDNYWGDCKCKKCQNIFGQNKLGKILMDIRSAVKQEVIW